MLYILIFKIIEERDTLVINTIELTDMPTPLTRDTLILTAPKLAQLSQEVLFDDIWQRPQLSSRDRSLITVAALVALERTQQLPWHLDFAHKNGIEREELIEVMTHLAFYAGWPAAVSSLSCLMEEEEEQCP